MNIMDNLGGIDFLSKMDYLGGMEMFNRSCLLVDKIRPYQARYAKEALFTIKTCGIGPQWDYLIVRAC